MPEDILYPIKARDEATPVFSRFLATLAEADKTTEKLKQKVDELSQRNEALTASLLKLEEEHGKYSAVLASAAKGSQEWSEAQAKVIVLDERLTTIDKELGKNKTQLSQAQQKLTEAAQVSTGAFQNLGAAVKNFAEAPLQTAHQGINALLSSLGPMAIGLGAVATGAIAAGIAIYKLAESARESAQQIQNMALQTGLSIDEVAALDRAAKELGVGDLTRTLANLQLQLGKEEGSKFTNILRVMQISTKEADGSFRSMVDILADFSDGLKEMGDPVRASQLALEAMGIRGRVLVPVLLNQNINLREYLKTLMEHPIRTKEAIDAEVKHKLQLDESLRSWERAKAKLGEFSDAIAAFGQRWAGLRTGTELGGGPAGLAMGLGFALTGKLAPGAGPKGAVEGAPAGMVGPPVPPGYYETRAAEIEAFNRRVSAIAQGLKGQELKLTLELQEAEEKLKKTILEGKDEEKIKQAELVAGIRARIEAIKQQAEEQEKLAKQFENLSAKLGQNIKSYGDIDIAQLAARNSAGEYVREIAAMAKWMSDVVPAGELMGDMLFDLHNKIVSDTEKLKEYSNVARGMPSTAHQLKSIPNALEPTKGKLDELGIGLSKTSERAKDLGRQVSTIFTDLSRDIADNILEWKGWGDSILGIVKDFAKGMLRMFLEQLFLPLEERMAGTMGGILGGGGGAGGGGITQFAQGGLGLLSGLFGGKGAFGVKASEVPDIGAIISGGAPAGAGGFWKGAGGSALLAGGMIGGSMLMSDAWKQGGARGMLEGISGGGLQGASIGTMIAPGIGTAIGAGIGAVAGFFAGLFGGGAKRRAEEAARRAGIQSQYLFSAPETISRTGAFATAGEADVESDLTGRVRAIPRPGAEVKVTIEALDVEDFERRRGWIGKLMSKAILRGGDQLADNIGYAAE